MKQFFKNAITSTVHWVKGMGSRVKTGVVAVCVAILSPVGAFAQSLANTGYDAGTSAMEEVATQIAAYVPYVVNLCYALHGGSSYADCGIRTLCGKPLLRSGRSGGHCRRYQCLHRHEQ